MPLNRLGGEVRNDDTNISYFDYSFFAFQTGLVPSASLYFIWLAKQADDVGYTLKHVQGWFGMSSILSIVLPQKRYILHLPLSNSGHQSS